MTRGLDTPLEIALGVVELARARYMDVIHDMTRMTVHWIVSDCDLGEVSVYTPSECRVGLRVYRSRTGVRGHVANMCLGS